MNCDADLIKPQPTWGGHLCCGASMILTGLASDQNDYTFVPLFVQLLETGFPGIAWPLVRQLSVAEANPEAIDTWKLS